MQCNIIESKTITKAIVVEIVIYIYIVYKITLTITRFEIK